METSGKANPPGLAFLRWVFRWSQLLRPGVVRGHRLIGISGAVGLLAVCLAESEWLHADAVRLARVSKGFLQGFESLLQRKFGARIQKTEEQRVSFITLPM